MEEVGGSFEIRPGAEGGALVRLTVPLASNHTPSIEVACR
jgi:hypothetical protein